jgi:twitching motility protein PilT
VLDLNQMLQHLVERRGSDLHIKVGSPPHIRVDGRLEPAPFDPVTPSDAEHIALSILPKERTDDFIAASEVDFAHSVGGVGRFRVNVHRQRGTVGVVCRRVPSEVPSVEALSLPSVVGRLAELSSGLVLVTGPAGSGKTTTVAAVLEHVNERQRANIVTIEDPIEFLFTDKQAIVSQRELGTDASSYADAMRRVSRQDPDVVFVGEISDADTAWAALAAADMGQLVVSTLPTTNATETVRRVIELFPPHRQRQVRSLLATVLRGTVSLRLLERADGSGRVPAVEVLIGTGRVFDVIVDPDHATESLEDAVADGEYYGMQTFDQSLFGLYKNGLVSLRDALGAATHPHDFRVSLQQAGLPAF